MIMEAEDEYEIELLTDGKEPLGSGRPFVFFKYFKFRYSFVFCNHRRRRSGLTAILSQLSIVTAVIMGEL